MIHGQAQKLLEDILENSILIERDPDPVDPLDNNPAASEVGIRLFKWAPPGIAPAYLLMELVPDNVLFWQMKFKDQESDSEFFQEMRSMRNQRSLIPISLTFQKWLAYEFSIIHHVPMRTPIDCS
ncbi:hypothetical protein RJ641_011454 [Dillenia turbinata]|uniref:Uncharacterized protein n=1 Tax=Dillenia turbinata TaxID=194707 RepID=A0AAN8UWF6_9MAGN